MTVFRDRFGNVLAEGDIVAFNPPRFKGLTWGRIDKFTPKMVRVNFFWEPQHFMPHQPVESTTVWPFDTVKCLNTAGTWSIMRMDDNGNQFPVTDNHGFRLCLQKKYAEFVMKILEGSAHKQTFTMDEETAE